MSDRISIPKETAFEAIRALTVRLRWYGCRGLTPPRKLTVALRYLAAAVGVDERRLRR